MNLLFLLTSKEDVVHIKETASLRQAIELMKHYRYSAIPVINEIGHYVGTLREGDLLWYIMEENHSSYKELEKISVQTILQKDLNYPCSIMTNMEDLLLQAMDQSFVPIIDDRKLFIGIVTRKKILQYYYDRICPSEQKMNGIVQKRM